MKDPRTSVQYKRATFRKLRDALESAQTKLTASQKHYEAGFDKKVRLQPFIEVGYYVYVYRTPCPLKSTGKGPPGSSNGRGRPLRQVITEDGRTVPAEGGYIDYYSR